ncbi:MAG: PEGA domain-containing protein [Candidatus Wildermuthbacteria bacterium]|nr:PEGA domain-containing protein [Candidatus Wildermuthbacteria bacterium]
MTKRSRTILFLALTAFFLLGTPSVILYSQGYRIDWNSKIIAQTGGLYIKATPGRADIYINNEFVKRTDFIFNSTLLGNLLPKSYSVRIEKEGFEPWTKTLAIQPKQVTQVKNVILFPEERTFKSVFQNVSQFWPSPEGGKLILQKTFPDNSWDLVLWEPAQNQERTIAKGKAEEGILSLQWAEDSSRILVRTISDKETATAIWNLQGNQRDPCLLVACSLDFTGRNILEASFVPQDPNQAAVLKSVRGSQELGIINYITKEPFTALASSVAAFTVQDKNLFYLTRDGTLLQKDLSSNAQPAALNEKAYPVQNETTYEIIPAGKDIFILEEHTKLSRLSPEKDFMVLSSNANSVAPDKDGKRIAYTKGSEIRVLYLEANDQLSLKQNSIVSLGSFGNTVLNLVWLENDYLAFTAGNEIKISETDSRDSVNAISLGTYPDPGIFWEQNAKALAVFSKGLVYVSEKLIP